VVLTAVVLASAGFSGRSVEATGNPHLHAPSSLTRPPQYAPDRIVVRFRQAIAPRHRSPDGRTVTTNPVSATTGVPEIDALNETLGVTSVESLFPPTAHLRAPDAFTALGMDHIYVLHFATPVDVPTVAATYAAQASVVYAEPDYVGHSGRGAQQQPTLSPNPALERFPSDTHFARQWGLFNDGTNPSSPVGASGTADADIDAELAWNITTGSSSIVVAVLDSGLKWDHPDIDSRVWRNGDEIAANGVDDDGNGYVDDVRGWDFANDDNDPMDDEGHGTNVAGIIGAESNNGRGYAGVDWHARIMPLKNLDDSGYGLYSWWAASIRYAADNGADVINMSEGGSASSPMLRTAIDYAHAAGCIVVAAAGNDNGRGLDYPAAYPNTIAVGATDTDDSRANPFFWGGGSNYGSSLDVVAPGNYVYGLSHSGNNQYNTYWGGTSQAVPHVSGLATLLLAQDPSRSFNQVRDIIRNTADDRVGPESEDTPGFDIYYGYGRINALRALRASQAPTATPTPDFWVYLPVASAGHAPILTPTPTATRVPLPGIHGRVTFNGEAAGATELRLRFYDGTMWTTAAATSTGDDGGYHFADVAALGPGQEYYVKYGPNVADSRFLFDWFGPQIIAYQAGTRLHGGDLDIANVEMVSPAPEASVGLPATFTWERRDLPGDSYRFRLFEAAGSADWITDDLGDVGSFRMETLPAEAQYGVPYGWDVWVCRSQDSCGSSFYYRIVTLSAARGAAPAPTVSPWSTPTAPESERMRHRMGAGR
jgi:subtilisin family serine protease